MFLATTKFWGTIPECPPWLLACSRPPQLLPWQISP